MKNGTHQFDDGTVGWFGRLRAQYKTYDEFESYANTHSLPTRLGFSTAEEAWDDNPYVHGSTDSAHYGLHEFPYAYLLVEDPKTGDFWIQEICGNMKMDLTLRVKAWIKSEYHGELRLDGEVCRMSCVGEYSATIYTDHRPPDSVVVWTSGSFFLKCTY